MARDWILIIDGVLWCWIVPSVAVWLQCCITLILNLNRTDWLTVNNPEASIQIVIVTNLVALT